VPLFSLVSCVVRSVPYRPGHQCASGVGPWAGEVRQHPRSPTSAPEFPPLSQKGSVVSRTPTSPAASGKPGELSSAERRIWCVVDARSERSGASFGARLSYPESWADLLQRATGALRVLGRPRVSCQPQLLRAAGLDQEERA
jgi:hypothetical protein